MLFFFVFFFILFCYSMFLVLIVDWAMKNCGVDKLWWRVRPALNYCKYVFNCSIKILFLCVCSAYHLISLRKFQAEKNCYIWKCIKSSCKCSLTLLNLLLSRLSLFANFYKCFSAYSSLHWFKLYIYSMILHLIRLYKSMSMWYPFLILVSYQV